MKSVLVWDWPIRVLHWLMVILFLAMVITGKSEEDYLEWHVDLGYALSAVLVARIIYGFVGSYYGLFKHALTSFKHTASYLRVFVEKLKRDNNKAENELGHNPLGWLMILSLVLILSIQIVSGLFSTDDIFWYGPFYDYASEEWLSTFAKIHGILPDVLIVLVILHIAAVLLHEICFKERIVIAMIHGRKDTASSSHTPIVKTPRIGVVLSMGVGLLWFMWLLFLPN